MTNINLKPLLEAGLLKDNELGESILSIPGDFLLKKELPEFGMQEYTKLCTLLLDDGQPRNRPLFNAYNEKNADPDLIHAKQSKDAFPAITALASRIADNLIARQTGLSAEKAREKLKANAALERMYQNAFLAAYNVIHASRQPLSH